jgi:hypothetical protein
MKSSFKSFGSLKRMKGIFVPGIFQLVLVLKWIMKMLGHMALILKVNLV